MALCQPHHRAPAPSVRAGLGYMRSQAVAPRPKPAQAQMSRSHFSCHANKTRSHRGPAPQLGVRWQILCDALSTHSTSGTKGLACLACLLQDGLTNCTRLAHSAPAGPVQPSHVSSQMEFDTNSTPPSRDSHPGWFTWRSVFKSLCRCQAEGSFPAHTSEEQMVVAAF